jgi:hypothetical protein
MKMRMFVLSVLLACVAALALAVLVMGAMEASAAQIQDLSPNFCAN